MRFEDAAAHAGFDLLGEPLRGGSGLVYRARHRLSGDVVALKILQAGHDVDRLRREGELLSRLRHPQVAGFRDLLQVGGAPTLVSEWIDGSSLHTILRDGPLRSDRAIRIFDQVVDGLAAVHAKGIVHGDVSPSNILVDRDDTVTIIDFGLSRSSDAATVTIDGHLAGTPRYLAPEVIAGAKPGPLSDQYSCALVLHEMLSGVWAFPEGDVIATALHHQLHTAPIPLAELNAAVPPSWTDAVTRALEKAPERRFRSVVDFRDALHATTAVSTLNHGRRVSVASLVFRVGLPLVLLAALLPQLLRDGDSGRLDEPSSWPAGTAATFDCNLLTEAGFESEVLPANWFVDEDDPSRPQVTVRPEGGVDDTGSLQIGEPDKFGLWGELVAVEPGRRYVFSAHTRIDGFVAASEMSVDWIDEDFGLFAASDSIDLLEATPGRNTLVTAPAPSGAAWAVPRTYKDNSEGVLILDEAIFALTGSACADALELNG